VNDRGVNLCTFWALLCLWGLSFYLEQVDSRRWSKADLGLGHKERQDPFPFQGDPGQRRERLFQSILYKVGQKATDLVLIPLKGRT